MLDSGFADYLRRIRPAHPLSAIYEDDGFLWKFVLCLIVVGALVLIILGVDSSIVKVTIIGVVALLVWIELKLDDSLLKKHLKRLHLLNVQWLCLKCHRHWIETKVRPMK